MLLMAKKGTRGGICQVIHRYAKANNKYMKSYDKSTTSSFLMYLDANNFYGWAMSHKLPLNGFEWVEYLSQFKDDLIKNHDENSDKGYVIQLDDEYPKNLLSLHSDLPFLPEKKKIGNVISLFVTFMTKKLC